MKRVFIFTEEHGGILAQKLPDAVPHNFDGLDCVMVEYGDQAAVKLAEAAAQITGMDASGEIEAEFRDFLEENEYIHLDAFIRICLEDITND